MKKDRKAILEHILSLKRFSATLISNTFSLELYDSNSICEEALLKNPSIEKWIRVKCPECKSIADGYKESDKSDLLEYYCDSEECKSHFSANDAIFELYYLNKSPAHLPEEHETADASATSLKTIKNMHSAIQETAILDLEQNYIWHISDLHLSAPKWFYRRWFSRLHGHSEKIKNEFLDVLKARKTSMRSSDLIVISGDCTDTGSEADKKQFDKFIKSITEAGYNSENILYIPGNHDAWCGSDNRRIFFTSLFAKEKKMAAKFADYPERSLPKCFDSFKNDGLRKVRKEINGLVIEFYLVNSSIPGELAKGIFPSFTLSKWSSGEIRVLVMHHHLVQDQGTTNLDSDHFENVKAMRVLNPAHALDFIFQEKFRLTLHGHNHLQFHKLEFKQDSVKEHVNILSAPSLFEADLTPEGDHKPRNKIGFNLIYPSKETSELFFFRIERNRYKLRHQSEISL